MSQPAPPPEAVLIRLVREAGNLKLPAVAKSAGISVARWSQIENGYEVRLSKRKPVQGSRSTIAHMAYAVGLHPDRLATEGGRPDAAEILREIWRQDGDGRRDPGRQRDDSTADLIRRLDLDQPIDEHMREVLKVALTDLLERRAGGGERRRA
jgi:transcriptional regulator with XRE-family HTH domain